MLGRPCHLWRWSTSEATLLAPRLRLGDRVSDGEVGARGCLRGLLLHIQELVHHLLDVVVVPHHDVVEHAAGLERDVLGRDIGGPVQHPLHADIAPGVYGLPGAVDSDTAAHRHLHLRLDMFHYLSTAIGVDNNVRIGGRPVDDPGRKVHVLLGENNQAPAHHHVAPIVNLEYDGLGAHLWRDLGTGADPRHDLGDVLRSALS
mmetsp:Transcript_62862/g.168214  ORF Transcript_62862/g.168214 Transcript_62862/m.168214 type:complete len:203 (-) Transcript_62862:412-1020(-)